MTSQLPWIEKYRPNKLSDIISHTEIINTLRIFMKKRCFPHILFYGPPGTGKTSTITACAKELYGKDYQYMVMELNASDERGIEMVRNKIIRFATTKPILGNNKLFKLVILDETDAMTNDAQAILRNVVEKYTSGTRFCLICNYIAKIIPALQSRCSPFRFSPIQPQYIKKSLTHILKSENIKSTPSGINTIVKRSKGDMRKVLNILQATHTTYNSINKKNVNQCIGFPQDNDITKVMESLNKDTFIESHTLLTNYIRNGFSLNDFVDEIHDIIIKDIMTNNIMPIIEQQRLGFILNHLRNIEYRQSFNTYDNVQLGAFVGIFKIKKIDL